MKDLRVASVQFQHAPGDKTYNLSVIERFVKQAAAQQVEIVLFPECCISGYWHLRRLDRGQLVELAESVPDGPSTEKLREWSRQYQLTLAAGLVEFGDDGCLYNSTVVAMPDGSFACHRKLHCFISEHLSSGNQFTVFDSPHDCRVAVLICYDNNIIENVRACALAGAELLLAPHQTGGCRSGSPHAMGLVDRALWEGRHADPQAIEAEFHGDKGRGWLLRWLPARAHDNGIFLVFSNGVGLDDDEVRTGNAMILDPYGRIIVETSKAADAMIVADLDASLRERCTGARWIRARRPELYTSLSTPTGREEHTRAVRFEHDD
jgi:predicted amidohydrolase